MAPLVLALVPGACIALIVIPVLRVTALVMVVDVLVVLARVAAPVPVAVLLAPDIMSMLVMVLLHAVVAAALLEDGGGVDRRGHNGEDGDDLGEKHSECSSLIIFL